MLNNIGSLRLRGRLHGVGDCLVSVSAGILLFDDRPGLLHDQTYHSPSRDHADCATHSLPHTATHTAADSSDTTAHTAATDSPTRTG